MDNKGRNRIRTVTAHAYQPEPQESKIWIPTTLEGEDNEDNRDLVEFTIALSEALHRTGLAAPTVEQTAAKVGEIFDVNVRVFSVPTATIYSFGDEERCVLQISDDRSLTDRFHSAFYPRKPIFSIQKLLPLTSTRLLR